MAEPPASRNGDGRNNDDQEQSAAIPWGLTFTPLVRGGMQTRPNHHGFTPALPFIALQSAPSGSRAGEQFTPANSRLLEHVIFYWWPDVFGTGVLRWLSGCGAGQQRPAPAEWYA